MPLETSHYKLSRSQIHKAFIFAGISSLFNSAMLFFVKLGRPTITLPVLILFRFLISFLFVFATSFFIHSESGAPFSIKSAHCPLQVVRALCGLASVWCYFYSVSQLSLANTTVLFNTAPLFIPLVALFWGRFPLVLPVIGLICMGFVGVILILHPTTSFINGYALIGLLSGFLAAVTYVANRYLLLYQDPPIRNMFYYFGLGTVISGSAWLFSGRGDFPLSGSSWLLLLAIGLLAVGYQ